MVASGGGAKAGPGGTFGTWISRLLIELPGEWAGLATAGNAEVFAVEGVFAERASLLFEEAGWKQRAVLSAVALSRMTLSSSLAHAVQNGSLRVHAVDSMANRACGFRARIGRNAAIKSSGSRAASSATIQPSTVSPRIKSSLPGSASTREPFSSSSP